MPVVACNDVQTPILLAYLLGTGCSHVRRHAEDVGEAFESTVRGLLLLLTHRNVDGQHNHDTTQRLIVSRCKKTSVLANYFHPIYTSLCSSMEIDGVNGHVLRLDVGDERLTSTGVAAPAVDHGLVVVVEADTNRCTKESADGHQEAGHLVEELLLVHQQYEHHVTLEEFRRLASWIAVSTVPSASAKEDSLITITELAYLLLHRESQM